MTLRFRLIACGTLMAALFLAGLAFAMYGLYSQAPQVLTVGN